MVALGAALAPLGWIVSDRLEQDNDFCVACHITEAGVTRPLHRAIRADFDHAPPGTLAAFHGTSPNAEGRAQARPRCIDCHGGTSFLGRVRVKALAAKDALVYVTGRFEEPTSMQYPLWDEDCQQCHKEFAPANDEADGAPSFHALAVHNTKLGVGCVECHQVHERGGSHETYFLRGEIVRGQCARCHAELAAP